IPMAPGPRRAQHGDGRGPGSPWRHADGHDHRPEGRPQPEAGALSGGGRDLDDDAVDQDGSPDCQPDDDPSLGAGDIPDCAAGAAWSGASRAARGHRGRTGGGTTAHPAAPDRGACRPARGARAAALILKAERPLIMLGAAASRPCLAEALSDFVKRVRIPFFNTQMGKGSVSGGSGLYMGTAALSERDYVHDAIDHADLIVTIGH